MPSNRDVPVQGPYTIEILVDPQKGSVAVNSFPVDYRAWMQIMSLADLAVFNNLHLEGEEKEKSLIVKPGATDLRLVR